jgi:hypothetical protein
MKGFTMLGIFNLTLRTATMNDKWGAPDHWKHNCHTDAFQRQQRKADEHRMRLAKDVGLW